MTRAATHAPTCALSMPKWKAVTQDKVSLYYLKIIICSIILHKIFIPIVLDNLEVVRTLPTPRYLLGSRSPILGKDGHSLPASNNYD